MTKYFCDRCKKVSGDRMNFISVTDDRKNHADLCDACKNILIHQFHKFLKEVTNG